MKIAIIGAGFTGLSAALELISKRHEVIVYEAEKKAGGLAGTFKDKTWDWEIEKYYHHIFANDSDIIDLAKGVDWPAFFTKPETNVWLNGKESTLDSPVSLLKFKQLSFWGRLRMGLGLFILKIIPKGQFLEKYPVVKVLPLLLGQEGYQKIWERLLVAKFGKYLKELNLSWFWARIVKRTASLGYFRGGFGMLASKVVEKIKSKGGRVVLGREIGKIEVGERSGFRIGGENFDRVLITTPAPLVNKLLNSQVIATAKINYLWSQTLAISLNRSLIGGYWLNILEKDWPFLVLVEHTKLVDKKYYGNDTVIYLGNYLEEGDKRLAMDEQELLRLFEPYIKKINPRFETAWVNRCWKFQSPFAQPVFPVNYSRLIPGIRTNVPGLYLANMSMVYPWDRGTNYAVKLGKKAAAIVETD